MQNLCILTIEDWDIIESCLEKMTRQLKYSLKHGKEKIVFYARLAKATDLETVVYVNYIEVKGQENPITLSKLMFLDVNNISIVCSILAKRLKQYLILLDYTNSKFHVGPSIEPINGCEIILEPNKKEE